MSMVVIRPSGFSPDFNGGVKYIQLYIESDVSVEPPKGAQQGELYVLEFIQGSAAGVLAFSGYVFAGGSAPVLGTTTGDRLRLLFVRSETGMLELSRAT